MVMIDTVTRIRNKEALVQLGTALRERRASLGLRQGQVRGMRQATVSKIERGGDVNLDTAISYAAALGLELTLAPIGQSQAAQKLSGGARATLVPAAASHDLLNEFSDLKD
jgi:transcriptional regulator with XRE-family HTH domain